MSEDEDLHKALDACRPLYIGKTILSYILHDKMYSSKQFRNPNNPPKDHTHTFMRLSFKYRATGAAILFLRGRRWGHVTGKVGSEHTMRGDCGKFEHYNTRCIRCNANTVLSITDGVPDVYRIDRADGRGDGPEYGSVAWNNKGKAEQLAGSWDYPQGYFNACPFLQSMK